MRLRQLLPSLTLLAPLTPLAPAALSAQARPSPAPNTTLQTGVDAAAYVPALAPLVVAGNKDLSELRDIVARFSADEAALRRRWNVAWSDGRRERFRQYYQGWLARLRELDFDRLGQQGKIDYVLMNHRLRHELTLLAREEKMFAEAKPLVPFAQTIYALNDARRRMEKIDPPQAAQTLVAIAKDIEKVSRDVIAGLQADSAAARRQNPEEAPAEAPPMDALSWANAAAGYLEPQGAQGTSGQGASAQGTQAQPIKTTKVVAHRSGEILGSLKSSLTSWYNFYSGYDPLFTWWAKDPYRRADSLLTAYQRTLRERVVGFRQGQPDPIIGDPIGRDEIIADLRDEMIMYSPEELMKVAEREFAWSEAEMKKAARDLGFGDDWRGALEKVKQMYVPPGEQPELIRRLAFEAIDFIEARNLVTVPPLARDIWRIEMMTPEAQRVSPFFLGGEVIQVSYPTDGMTHEEKMMSMRGNNPHFSHATVHHELIPGHHLQGYMNSRYNDHRRPAFGTPFWTEGWALYWEMILWDQGFNATPEDRIGALFWRMHRCARILFSLGFHLGTMTPQQAIDMLVDRVGHERANAEAEVRRSFLGTYPPLYQLAYMMGGLQFRALHQELVGSGRMTNKDFHDAVLKGGAMPVEMVRAMLTGTRLTRDYAAQWRYAGDLP